MAKVEVRPIDRPKWHGKKGKENFAQPMILEALYDPITGKYATGLDDKTRTRLEKATGYDLSDTYKEEPHPFWSSKAARIKLPAQTVVFDTSNPLDEIKVHVLKASKFIANSLREYEEGLYPEATHVIYDESEEIKMKASKVQKKKTAIKLANKMTTDEKANIIQILNGKNVRGQSQDYLDVMIDDLIEEDIDKFIEYAKLDKQELYLRATILEGLHKNILTKEGNAILYMGDMIGHNIDEAVNYFTDPNNQGIKARVLEKITS
jgi:hypothetical protein